MTCEFVGSGAWKKPVAKHNIIYAEVYAMFLHSQDNTTLNIVGFLVGLEQDKASIFGIETDGIWSFMALFQWDILCLSGLIACIH